MRNKEYIVIEKACSGKHTIWSGTEEEIKDVARELNNFRYHAGKYNEIAEMYEEGDELEVLKKFAEFKGDIVEYSSNGDDIEYSLLEDAPSEFEIAKDAIANDLQSCEFLTLEEAKERLKDRDAASFYEELKDTISYF